MLAGLAFASEEEPGVGGSPDQIAALPFAGVTIVEHQARLLIAAGASHIVILSPRPGAALTAAAARLARRGVAVDLVQDARAAAAAIHPLSQLVMLADGLVSSEGPVAALAGEGGEALLVLPVEGAPTSYERIGGGCVWAGIARLDPRRLVELAELPPDYAPQSTLLRLVEAAGAKRLRLDPDRLDAVHAIVGSAASLDLVERQRIALIGRPRGNVFDDGLVGPATRAMAASLTRRHVGTPMVAGAAAVIAAAGIAAIAADHVGAAALIVLIALWLALVARGMAALREETGITRWVAYGVGAAAAVAAPLLGWRTQLDGGGGALPVALAGVVAVALTERTGAAPHRWWAGIPGCVVLVAAIALAGQPFAGLTIAALYAVAMLAAAIERLRGLARL